MITENKRKEMSMAAEADLGLIGLGVMGRNLALNADDHGYTVAVYNRTVETMEEFLEEDAAGTAMIGARTLEDLVDSLKRPRRVLLMVKAGPAVDAVIEQVAPLLEEGDIIIDGGNSHYEDTTRRVHELEEKGLLFVGAGISGGEEGARYGPSIMPGGAPEAWPHIRPVLQAVAAKAEDGEPCCNWVGEEGAGHYVKMVHNGIEYGNMQLIAESYDLMQRALGMTSEEMSAVFAQWDDGQLNSYLIEITAEILAVKDEDGQPLVDKILDSAGQKGTGKWTAIAALEEGIPLALIGEAVFARFLSALKEERQEAEEFLGSATGDYMGERRDFLDYLGSALYAGTLVSYAQGFMLLRAAADSHGWNLDLGAVAALWRAGCIIRAGFLDEIKSAFERRPDLPALMLDPYFKEELRTAEAGWREVAAQGALLGIPAPALSSGLAFYDGYRRGRLPANLIQAQRDYFGAHTYERVDRPRGEFFHTEWMEKTEA
ncbi:MAG TPA: decarboxylating NADP(+)-dependent phosphogluconate dehydrogenase [Candidatus Sulfomarinibacteraceae bacterium]|nr:decarboxylating NADP(+)-dependent phosphogluconate dehydrogenase [Candidatus Sulfomarinibacteraceae bacterium]